MPSTKQLSDLLNLYPGNCSIFKRNHWGCRYTLYCCEKIRNRFGFPSLRYLGCYPLFLQMELLSLFPSRGRLRKTGYFSQMYFSSLLNLLVWMIWLIVHKQVLVMSIITCRWLTGDCKSDPALDRLEALSTQRLPLGSPVRCSAPSCP